MRNLFIIGNGFDLAHDLKTSYNHFIEHIVNIRQQDKNAYNDIFIRGQQNNIKTEILKPNWIDNFIGNKFLGILLKEKNNSKWVDIEKAYFKELKKSNVYENNIEKLNKDFQAIKNYLEDYLENHCKNKIVIESYSNLFSRFDTKGNVILNFNFTNTIERYKINYAEVINIHGQLKSQTNKIIFGYAANSEEENTLIKLDNINYLENIKRFRYLEALNEVRFREFLKEKKPFDVHIIGHSMGLSDKQILKSIITHEKINKIRSYYYKGNYFETNINTHALLENSQTYIPMAPLPNCHQAPQHDDDEPIKSSFKTFIDKITVEQHADNKLYSIK